MERTTLIEGEYTFDASAKTITLAAPYDALNQAQIVSIFDITSNDSIFEVGRRRNTISLSGDVITYTSDNSNQNDTDKLRIIIETELIDLTDADRVLFEEDSINPSEIGTSVSFNIMGYEGITLFIKTLKNFEVYVQLTDNTGVNPDWFDLCTVLGVAISFTCNNASKAISVPCKAAKVRVLMKNNDTVASIPYVGVI